MSKTLASIVRPISISEFSADYYSKKPLYIGECPDKFQKVFGWESLNRILNSSPVPHPTMKMVLEGKPVIPTDAASIIQRCREGASLVIEEIHKYDACVGKLAAELSAEISEPTRVNLYLSQPSRQGYNRHYDTHDVFILQIEGYKGWRVFDFTIEYPLFVQKTHGSDPPTIPLLECTLKPGDVLYIPRGHWHEATAQVKPSLHLTLGIYARTGIDFLSWLTDELREDVRWRETFPLNPRELGESISNDSAIDLEHFEKLKGLLVSKISDRYLLQEYRRFCIAQERRVNPFSFPSHVLKAPPISESTAFSRPVYQQVALEIKNSGMVEITVWGQVVRFNGPVEGILRYIFSVHLFTGRELLESAPELSWTDIETVLNSLLQERVVEIVQA
jgi:ribosomal protein L16 Arg81 hydroxylase